VDITDAQLIAGNASAGILAALNSFLPAGSGVLIVLNALLMLATAVEVALSLAQSND